MKLTAEFRIPELIINLIVNKDLLCVERKS